MRGSLVDACKTGGVLFFRVSCLIVGVCGSSRKDDDLRCLEMVLGAEGVAG